MKIVIGDPKSGKSYMTELPKEKEASIYGMRIGDTVDGSVMGAAGYTLKISGGSDRDGFPMKSDVPGTGKRGLLLDGPPGFRPKRKGEWKRKMVRGAAVSEWIAQLNVTVTEAGPTSLEQLFPKVEKEGKEEKKEEKKPKSKGKKK